MQNKQTQELSTLQSMLQHKNLSPDLFNPQQNPELSLDCPLSDHVRWVFNNIYSLPYVSEKSETAEIKREIHGIQHVTRVAFYTQVFANFYRKHGDKEALALTEEDLKLLQIAALFHDSGREDEDEDLTDHQSGLLLYFYLRNILKVDKEKAKFIAEATANKDFVAGKNHPYYEINQDDNEVVSSGFVLKSAPLTIYHKIIHDADCLDILRARLCFDANYLYFYQFIASNPENKIAFEEMVHLIKEARSLIHLQGDSFDRLILEIKKKFEHENAFNALRESIDKERHPILNALGNALLGLDQLREMNLLKPKSDEKFQSALDNCQLFARSIGSPSAIMQNKSTKPEETAAQLENRKNMRTPNIASRTIKTNHKNKHGNLNRSISMLGFGMPPFADAGGIIIGLNKESISKISATDFGSGRAKKEGIVKEYINQPELLEKASKELEKTIKMGGKIAENGNYIHNEILYDITKFDAIYYCDSPNLYSNHLLFNSVDRMEKSMHKFSPVLQGIYLQKQYEIQYEEAQKIYESTFGKESGYALFIERFGPNKRLPILEYSAVNHEVRIVNEDELTDEKIIQMWTEMCSSYLQILLKSPTQNLDFLKIIYDTNPNKLKTCSMYGQLGEQWEGIKRHAPADANYNPVLVQKINQSIAIENAKIIRKYEELLVEKIHNDSLSIFSEHVMYICPKSEIFQASLQKEIIQGIEKGMRLLDQNFKKLSDKSMRKYYNKIYEYSKVYGLKNQLETLQEKTAIFFQELFNKTQLDFYAITHQIKPWHASIKPIDDLLNLIEKFGLPQSAKDQVGTLMSKVLIYASEKFTKLNNIVEYANLVETMQQHGFIKPQHNSSIEKAYEESAKLLEEGEYDLVDINGHLAIEQLVKDSPENIINNLLNWMDNSGDSIEPKHLKLLLNYSSDPRLFKKILNNIKLPQNILDTQWMDIILELQQKNLNSGQIKLLAKKCKEFCSRYIEVSEDLFTHKLSFESFIYMLIKARNAKLPVEIFDDSLVQTLKNEYDNLLTDNQNNLKSVLPCLADLDWLGKMSPNPEFSFLVEKLKTIDKALSANDFSNPLFFEAGKLNLKGRSLTKFTIEKFLLPVLEHYTNEIVALDCSSCELNDINIPPLAIAIGKLKNLKVLNISNNDISDSGAEHLINNFSHSVRLEIDENRCDPKDIQEKLDNKFMKKESYQLLNFFTSAESGGIKPVQTVATPYQ